MNELDISAESFQLKFDKFLIGCEAVENATLWDIDTYGEMEDYYAMLLVSIILRTVTAGSATARPITSTSSSASPMTAASWSRSTTAAPRCSRVRISTMT